MAIIAVIGNVVRIGPSSGPITVRDSTGALVTPATITVTVRRPDATNTTPTTPTLWTTLSLYPIGAYYLDYEPASSSAMIGTHTYRVVTTNPDAAFEDTITFVPSPFF